MHEIRVLLVDDHAELRAELRRLIDSQPDLRLVAEAGGAQEAVRLAMEQSLMVVVMDLSLPDGDGITGTAAIVQQRPELRVIGLSRHDDPGHVARMLAAGASGYVVKTNAAQELIPAIRTVAAGGTYIDPSFVSKPRESPPEHRSPIVQEGGRVPAAMGCELSPDELAVLQRVAWGHNNREIADQLGMPVTAVVERKTQAMGKLGLSTRVDVIRYAEARGWKREETS
jgi:two-component system, NarL family, response regulator NreC